MMAVRFGSFNLHGMDDVDVAPAIQFATQHLALDDSSVRAIAFQEVWFQRQVDEVIGTYSGAGGQAVTRANVEIWRAGDGAWRCLVPQTRPVMKLPKSSGLVLCVRGSVRDSFFVKYRGGELPDSAANKGILAALVDFTEFGTCAVLNTHLHDYQNDRSGRARYAWLDTLVSCVNWIRSYWRAPIVLLGDFNIDSIRAYAQPGEVDFRCYSRLIRAGMSLDQTFYDVNVHVHHGAPVRTNCEAAVDHHLISGLEIAQPAFSAIDTDHSDHRLTISSW